MSKEKNILSNFSSIFYNVQEMQYYLTSITSSINEEVKSHTDGTPIRLALEECQSYIIDAEECLASMKTQLETADKLLVASGMEIKNRTTINTKDFITLRAADFQKFIPVGKAKKVYKIWRETSPKNNQYALLKSGQTFSSCYIKDKNLYDSLSSIEKSSIKPPSEKFIVNALYRKDESMPTSRSLAKVFFEIPRDKIEIKVIEIPKTLMCQLSAIFHFIGKNYDFGINGNSWYKMMRNGSGVNTRYTITAYDPSCAPAKGIDEETKKFIQENMFDLETDLDIVRSLKEMKEFCA